MMLIILIFLQLSQTALTLLTPVIAVIISYLMLRFMIQDKLDKRIDSKANIIQVEQLKNENTRAHAEIKEDLTITENRLMEQQKSLKEDNNRNLSLLSEKIDIVNNNVNDKFDLVIELIKKNK